jgi:putative hemolysin
MEAIVTATPMAKLARLYPFDFTNAPRETIETSKYVVRFAQTEEEVDRALKLRFEVFNLELKEGLDSSFITGRDEDEFDATCHHLIITEKVSGAVIGTYRVRTLEMAEGSCGFYSAGEFNLACLPREVLKESIEIGRACIAREHRNTSVLFLLWQGLAMYITQTRKRYLFGCCSLTSQDTRDGMKLFSQLAEKGQLHPTLHVTPQPECACDDKKPSEDFSEVKIPKLFYTYLRFGSRVCGPPAIDRQFKTIDFFVIFDVEEMDARTKQIFFGST